MTTMTGRRPALGHSSRTARKAPLPPRLGMYACTGQPHPFRPLDMTSCALCFGWRDDYRHTDPAPLHHIERSTTA